MKKKFLFAFLIIILTLSLIGCGNQQSVTTYDDTPAQEIVNETAQFIQEPTEEPTESPTESPKVNIEWSDLTYGVKDTEGYSYEITYHLSPWILLSNTDTLNAAWNEVGKGNSLPGFDDWGLEKKGNNYWRQLSSLQLHWTNDNFSAPMSDMYYCVGTVTITNETDGFDIVQSSPRAVNVPLKLDFEDKYDWAPAIGRIFFSDKTSDTYLGLYTDAQMKSNKWGSVPVIFMAPENYSPKYPDGQYSEPLLNSAYFRPISRLEYAKWNGTDISYGNDYPRVGLIDKDGIYRTE